MEDQEILLERLDNEVATVQAKFGSLTRSFVNFLSSNEVPVAALALFVSSFTTFIATRPNDSRLFCEVKAEFHTAKEVIDLFLILGQYWSWINYDLLEKIIDEFGNDEIKTHFEKYREHTLEPFLQRSVIEIPSNAYGHTDIPHFRKVSFKFGTDMESHSASNLRKIRNKVATILGIDSKALHISAVRDGCMEIDFLVPKVVFDAISQLPKDLQLLLAGFEIDDKSCKVEEITSSEFSFSLVSNLTLYNCIAFMIIMIVLF